MNATQEMLQAMDTERAPAIAKYLAHRNFGTSHANNYVGRSQAVWRWYKYKGGALRRVWARDNGDGSWDLCYHNPDQEFGYMILSNVRPVGVKNPKLSDPIITDKRIISGNIVQKSLLTATKDGEISNTSEYAKTVTASESFIAGVETAIESTTTIGGEASQFKEEFKISVTASYDETHGKDTSVTSSNSITVTEVAEAGYITKVISQRSIGDAEQTFSGSSDFEHSIKIGKGDKKRSSHGKYYIDWSSDGVLSLDSYDAFKLLVSGAAGDNQKLGAYFRDHPLGEVAMKQLDEVLNVPFSIKTKYDGSVIDTSTTVYIDAEGNETQQTRRVEPDEYNKE